MSRASQPDKQNGALSVHTIRASGHVHRNNRPNTRLHPTTTPKHQINPCNAGAIHTGHSELRLPAIVPLGVPKAGLKRYIFGELPICLCFRATNRDKARNT
jgi:hypothetical protein